MFVDEAPRQRYGRIIVVGGGCYGSYYVRQLERAIAAGAIEATAIVVVDRDPACAVARDRGSHSLPLVIDPNEWSSFFDDYLSRAAADPASVAGDAIVPSPLMPHLMGDWLFQRATRRWPERHIVTAPLTDVPAVPWSRAGTDRTHYVSFATWMCPINCVEPRTCPHTRGARSWSMPVAIESHARRRRDDGARLHAAVMFCKHRAYGVGMFDTAEVLAADALIASEAAANAAEFMIGTVSHCHGALTRLVVPAASEADSHVG
jgi:hypothetical protein